jgi:hypothetical protein
VNAMWGSIELEPEIRQRYLALPDGEADRVRFHIDRLSELGATLGEPQTRQLDGSFENCGSISPAGRHGLHIG